MSTFQVYPGMCMSKMGCSPFFRTVKWTFLGAARRGGGNEGLEKEVQVSVAFRLIRCRFENLTGSNRRVKDPKY